MKLILNLFGAVGLLIAGGTIILIMCAIKRKGYIRIVETNGMIQNIELGAGIFLVLAGLISAIWACNDGWTGT